MNRERDPIERYAYCLCLHVKPATIYFGVTNLIAYSLMILIHLSSLGYQTDPHFEDRHGNRWTTTCVVVATYTLCATVSLMLLYGVAKSRAAYLMPFFIIQLYHFFFSLPLFLFPFNARSAPVNSDVDTQILDVKHGWNSNASAKMYSFSPLLEVCVMLYKGYFLCVVWKCYRYLKIQSILPPLNCRYATVEATVPVVSHSMGLPPNYETVINSNPPPDYETALRASQSVNNEKRTEISPDANEVAVTITTPVNVAGNDLSRYDREPIDQPKIP
ncbi:hypothetical protein B4U80_00062 [Leptotrombidium deliense]|uniref:Uncharacterized protein n=1 Tax=Leptotrombidium deliense TaxID=299467 RepID=A0A443SV25_9ACAR|nr:hypothetical protein B4U80_00062 [Leptotrombidium deliense]